LCRKFIYSQENPQETVATRAALLAQIAYAPIILFVGWGLRPKPHQGSRAPDLSCI